MFQHTRKQSMKVLAVVWIFIYVQGLGKNVYVKDLIPSSFVSSDYCLWGSEVGSQSDILRNKPLILCRLILILSLWSPSCLVARILGLIQHHVISSIKVIKVPLCRFLQNLLGNGLLLVWSESWRCYASLLNKCYQIEVLRYFWFVHVKVQVMERCAFGRSKLEGVSGSGSLGNLYVMSHGIPCLNVPYWPSACKLFTGAYDYCWSYWWILNRYHINVAGEMMYIFWILDLAMQRNRRVLKSFYVLKHHQFLMTLVSFIRRLCNSFEFTNNLG